MVVTVELVMCFVVHTAGPLTRVAERKIGPAAAYRNKYAYLAKSESWRFGGGFDADMAWWKSCGMPSFDKADLARLLASGGGDTSDGVVRALYLSI